MWAWDPEEKDGWSPEWDALKEKWGIKKRVGVRVGLLTPSQIALSWMWDGQLSLTRKDLMYISYNGLNESFIQTAFMVAIIDWTVSP